jgi:transcriptional regulator with XRE-family HTH domain
MGALNIKERVIMKTALKEIRQEKGFMQLVVAKEAGIPIRTYQNYEYGRIPDVHAAQQIASIIGEDVTKLFPLPERELGRKKGEI